MGLFSKKKGVGVPSVANTKPEMPTGTKKAGAPTNIPLEQVTRMKQQGLTNTQIVQTLQRNGYQSHQIFDAMNQANLTSGAPQPVDPPPTQAPQQDMPDLFPGSQAYETKKQEFEDFEPSPEVLEFGTGEMDRIEEVAEAIIEEKWSELMKNIHKIIEWKERIEARINALEQQMDDIRASLNELNRSLIEKMGDYDKSMSNVGTEIKAMEKVFQKMLPSLADNVAELSRITKDIKQKKA